MSNAVTQNQILNSKNGVWFGPPNAEAVVKTALASPLPVVIWFHGGLVSENAGTEKAHQLAAHYAKTGSCHPLFFVWDSGLMPALRDGLIEVAKRALSKAIIRILSKYVDARLWDTAAGTNRFQLDGPLSMSAKDSVIPKSHRDAIAEALQNDPDFLAEVEHLSSTKKLGVSNKSVGFDPRNKNSQDIEARLRNQMPKLEDFSDEAQRTAFLGDPVTRWLIRFAITVAYRCARRYLGGRWHGTGQTIFEEICRAMELPLDVWADMRRDVASLFEDSHCGHDFLKEFKVHESDFATREIYLVGHSAGSIGVSHFLAKAQMMGISHKFKVRLAAPAISCQSFVDTLSFGKQRIADIRTFCLNDQVEQDEYLLDKLVPKPLDKMYHGSLLWLVSGGLEQISDVPLLGMERFLGGNPGTAGASRPRVVAAPSLNPAEQAIIEKALEILHIGNDPNAITFTPTPAGSAARVSCSTTTHGGFDEPNEGYVDAILL